MASDIDIAVIGGGVIGCAVAWELSPQGGQVFLFEKNRGITQGENQSTRNSGVIHSGIYYDQETRPNKASLCVSGNRLLYDFCRDHKVPAVKTGKLIVATNEREEEVLDIYLGRARENRVPDVEKISGRKAEQQEPNVKARAALMVPSAGIVDPVSLVYRLYTLASGKGVQFMTETEVIELDIDNARTLITIKYPDGQTDQVRARIVINAAGIEADCMARLVNPASPYELDPVRGESYKFYGHRRAELELRGTNIYPTPESVITPHGRHFTVGIHLTPTFGDLAWPPLIGSTVTVGPKLVPVEDRNAWAGEPTPGTIFAEKARSYFPGLRDEDLEWHQAGMQARLKGCPDFVIESDPVYGGFINLLGIDSPGLTSCLAIARETAKEVKRCLG
ncbi:MAG: FAD-dependent oxidoreductase [Desulfatiglans sp.]|nr:FAD-dependent oxidoreductase [Thermodesulfobacteriota bacterium]MEE4351648.1 FAD-dependent oxidoreductase [Desulfatiglans sp.]